MTPSTTKLASLPPKVKATAIALLTAAAHCDKAALDKLTSATTITGAPPGTAWVQPDPDSRYAAVVTLLSNLASQHQALGESDPEFVWPRVESELGYMDNAAWAEVVAAGLMSKDEAAAMRANHGYTGWRIHITDTGVLLAVLRG